MVMQHRLCHRAAGLLALAGGVCAGAAAYGAPTFTPLGDLFGGQNYSEACGVSADGHIVVGTSIIDGNMFFGATFGAFRWDEQSGMQLIYTVPGVNTSCTAYAANEDGTVIVGTANHSQNPANTQAFMWTPLGTTEFGDLSGGALNGAARGVSANGLVIAGVGESDSGPEAFGYTDNSGFQGLGDLPGGPFNSAAFGISADGGTIVGTSHIGDQNSRLAFRWTQSEGMVSLGHLGVPDGIVPLSEAYGTNVDGSVIVGMSRSLVTGNAGWEAFRWTQEGGMVSIGDIAGGVPFAIAFGTSADGSIVVGRGAIEDCNTPVGCITVYRAFIWDAVNGMRDLNTVLTDMGVNLNGWKLSEARGISGNGRVIVGNGSNALGEVQGWRVEFEFEGCPADFNGDDQVDFFDYLDFVAAFDAESPSADFNGDNQVDFFDYLDFASAFDSCS
jgi:probable HAF family extracellular repeat protein